MYTIAVKVTNIQILDTIKECHGNLGLVCLKLGMSRGKIMRRLSEQPILYRLYKEYMEESETTYKKKQDNRTVYLIQEGWRGHVKIGITGDVSQRLKSLKTSCPQPLKILAHKRFPYAGEIEQELHQKFETYRVRGEWFNIPEHILDFTIKMWFSEE